MVQEPCDVWKPFQTFFLFDKCSSWKCYIRVVIIDGHKTWHSCIRYVYRHIGVLPVSNRKYLKYKYFVYSCQVSNQNDLLYPSLFLQCDASSWSLYLDIYLMISCHQHIDLPAILCLGDKPIGIIYFHQGCLKRYTQILHTSARGMRFDVISMDLF